MGRERVRRAVRGERRESGRAHPKFARKTYLYDPEAGISAGGVYTGTRRRRAGATERRFSPAFAETFGK